MPSAAITGAGKILRLKIETVNQNTFQLCVFVRDKWFALRVDREQPDARDLAIVSLCCKAFGAGIPVRVVAYPVYAGFNFSQINEVEMGEGITESGMIDKAAFALPDELRLDVADGVPIAPPYPLPNSAPHDAAALRDNLEALRTIQGQVEKALAQATSKIDRLLGPP